MWSKDPSRLKLLKKFFQARSKILRGSYIISVSLKTRWSVQTIHRRDAVLILLYDGEYEGFFIRRAGGRP